MSCFFKFKVKYGATNTEKILDNIFCLTVILACFWEEHKVGSMFTTKHLGKFEVVIIIYAFFIKEM